MIDTATNATAQKLLETFSRFRRLSWRQSSIEGFTAGEIHLLSTIKRMLEENQNESGIRVSDISHLMNVAPPTVTQQLNNLEARGYIARNMDTGDRRVIRVTFTEKGERVLQKVFDNFTSTVTGLVAHLGEEDSDRLADLLQKVYTYFQEHRPPA